eukprot:scaffold7371_cov70-Phaeocystis_antarctica.AAC.4
MGARHGKVRLRASHANDARGLAANGGLGSVVAAGDVAGIGERQHLLRRSRCRRRTALLRKLLIQLLQPLVARHHRVEEQLAKVLHECLRLHQRLTQRVTPTGVEQRLQRVPRGRLARLAHTRRLRLALQLLLGLQLTLLELLAQRSRLLEH